MPRSIAVSVIPTVASLYRTASSPLNRAAAAATSKGDTLSTHSTPSQAHNEIVSLITADLTTLEVDAIVNAANTSLLGGGGVDGAIHRGAGPRLRQKCEALNGCRTGSAKMTKGYELPCRHVIHAVGPVYRPKSSERSAKLLAGCYQTALELARDAGLASIAFSAISTGVYGYPSEAAADVALSTVRKFLDKQQLQKQPVTHQLKRVIFCNFSDKDIHAYNKLMPEYFPPVKDAGDVVDAAKDVPNKEEAAAARSSAQQDNKDDDDLVRQLPDPPTQDPAEAEGAPVKKRVKLDSSGSDKQPAEDEGSQHTGLSQTLESAGFGSDSDDGSFQEQHLEHARKRDASRPGAAH